MHTLKSHNTTLAFIPWALIVAVAVLCGGMASAGSIDGAWVWPQVATANSCRWLRVQVSHSSTEWIHYANVSGIYGTAPNYAMPPGFSIGTLMLTPGNWPRENSDTTVHWQSGNTHYLTIGPFCGDENMFDEPPADYPYVIGYLGSPGSNTTRPTNSATYYVEFHLRFATSSGPDDDETVSGLIPYQTVHDNDDRLEWWTPDDSGGIIDPLSVGPVEVLPDSASGSSALTFRVRYQSGLYSGLNLPPRWRTSEDFSGGYSFLDRARGYASNRSDPGSTSQFNWIYGRTTDTWFDQTGYARSEFNDRCAFEPQVALVIDGQHWAPHFMTPENTGDTDYTDGAMFEYTILPTDYQNFIDNIFQFPYDLPGTDPWDTYAMRMTGRPASNNYVSMAAGGHTYEFWATDDFAPVKNRAWVQVGWPGNDCHVEYMERIAPEARRVDGLRSALHRSRISVWRQYSPYAGGNFGVSYDPTGDLRRFGDMSVDQPDAYGYTYKSHEAYTDADIANLDDLDSPDPTLSLRKLPNVNPVLTAHPFFGLPAREGGISTPFNGPADDPNTWLSSTWWGDPSVAGGYIDNDIPNNTFIAGADIGANDNPFAVEAGAGPNAPWKYTNDDTILPNYANIWDETAASPFMGGKWTQSTKYTLRINYWHSENVAPSLMRVYIRANDAAASPGSFVAYTMERHDPTDTDYTDGCVYQYQVTPDQLPDGGAAGDYNYYFVASDGTRQANFPNRPDAFTPIGSGSVVDPGDIGVAAAEVGEDYYWFRVNRPPDLANESVSPVVGRTGDDFVFRVQYTDPDGEALNPSATGDRPFIALLHVDLFGDENGQGTVNAVTSETTLDYMTTTGNVYAVNELAGLDLVVRTGAAVRNSYEILGNNGSTITLVPGATIQTDGMAAGDRFHVADWQQTAMSKEDPSDDDYTDGVWYVYNTATNMALGPGVHHYYFHFADDWGGWVYPGRSDVRVEGEYVRYPNAGEFEGPEVIANTPPRLVDFRFAPDAVGADEDGTTATSFTFFVSYEDDENDPPSFIRLGIDGTSAAPATTLSLFPENPADTVYTDGATYESPPIRLTEGRHVFRAQASDGEERYPLGYAPGDPLPFKGPVATVTAVHSATSLDYSIGGAAFPDGRLVGLDIELLDANGMPTGTVSAITDNTGATVTCAVAHGASVDDEVILDGAPGPDVAPNTPPQLGLPADDNDPLNAPGLDPDEGRQTTTFTYTVIYYDDDQFAGVRGNPPSYVRVYIDNVEHDMTKVDAGDNDYTTTGGGAEYQFTISGLVEGTPHTYFFVASDGLDTARLPAAAAVPNHYEGPLVDEPPDAPKQLFVTDTAGDNGGSLDFTFNAALDDGGGPDDVIEYHLYRDTTGTFAGNPVWVVPANDSPSYAGVDAVDALLGKTEPITGVDYYYMARSYDGATIDVDGDGVPDDTDGDGILDVTIDPDSQSADSNVEGPVAAVDNIAPEPPTDLTATDLGVGGTIDLNWTLSPDDPADGSGPNQDVIEYHLYRNETGAPFTGLPLATIAAGETNYTDSTVTDGTDYYYTIRAYDGSNESADAPGNSNTVGPVTSTDVEPPEIINTNPSGGDTNVPVNTNIEFTVRDSGAGVDVSTLVVEINGTDVTADLDLTGSGAQVNVSYDPPDDFDHFVSVTVHIEVSDLAGRALDPPEEYTFTITGPPTFTISGMILDRADAPVVGVDVSAGALSATTDATGYYEITGLADGTYSVVPTLADTAFLPESIAVTIPPSAGGISFIAEPGYDIRGQVLDQGGAGMAGVRVTDGLHEDLTDAAGNYEILDIRAGDYTVVPQLAGHTFTPSNTDVTLPTAPDPPGNAEGVDFTGDVEKFSVAGNIRSAAGVRLADVNVEADDGAGGIYNAITNASGGYVLSDLPAGSYTLTPTKTNWVFEPATRAINIAGDQTNVDFIAIPLYTLTLAPGLRMVSLPITPLDLDPVANVPATITIARYNPKAVPPDYIIGDPPGLPEQYEMLAGRSFWMRNATGAGVDLEVAGESVDTGIAFSLGLERGWNMAGNMFEGNLPWSHLNIAPGHPVRDYGFLYNPATGGYDLVTDMVGIGTTGVVPRNEGFWMKSDAKRTVTVTPVSGAEAREGTPSVELGAGDYLIPIVVSAAGRADTSSVAGVIEGSEGVYEIENPPAASSYVDLYFTTDDGRRLACDVRSAGPPTATWEFVVATDLADATIELRLPDLTGVDNDKSVTLVDHATGKRVYARTMNTYAFAGDETGCRRFTLEIAPRAEGGLAVTAASARQTGAGAVVTYALNQAAADVTITVMNIAGRPVRVLRPGSADTVGAQNVVWNLRATNGSRVPGGRYLVRVKALGEDGQITEALTSLQIVR